jgi:hypothetical protein
MKNRKTTGTVKNEKKSVVTKSYNQTSKAKKVMGRPEVMEAPAPVKTQKTVTSKKAEVEILNFPASNFSSKFDHPVRTYWNLKLEKKNSSCAKAGTPLEFEFINQNKKGTIVYRIRRGKRSFFTTSLDLQTSKS